ncbi:MAG: quinone-dependent dihydroorotate dehydrogenase [Cyclobacteriaceae bacterium]|nr:quinone-dependent dihydroorotate dehydrogenase [Cyclobacteriaceae bacterium]
MYSLIRSFLFLFSPEKAHKLTFLLLEIIFSIPGTKCLFSSFYSVKHPKLHKTLWGITFENPVGLAAGFDKDAKYIDLLDAFGFGFIEIGTLTPRAQEGNPQPRLFRLPKDKALINRMGFNNQGAATAISRLKRRKSKVIVGGNIGKNKVTPNEHAIDDYVYGIDTLYDYVDYFAVNLSSPNTPGLRELQEKEPLKNLLKGCQKAIASKTNKKPLLLKIAPDLTEGQIKDIAEIAIELNLDGLIATNTTIDRTGLITNQSIVEKIGNGGLSGKPLTHRSTEVIKELRKLLPENFPIIAVGGIMTPEDALEKLKAGATLVQIYTGFIYNGPGFVKNINKTILKDLEQID